MAVTGILGKKIGMTQVFDEKGDVHPITVLQAGPCVITQLKSLAKDGYEAAQIGLVEFIKNKNVTKPQAGHFAKTEAPPVKVIKEVDLELDAEGVVATKAGDRVLVDIFSNVKFVDVIGTSKGRGFAGVVRRHGFAGGPKSHGHMFQVQGSIGASAFRRACFLASVCRATWARRRSRYAICVFAASTLKRICSWWKARYRDRVKVTC